MIAEIDGHRIRSEADFHKEIVSVLSFSHYYGRNLNALWDVLSRDLERPVTLVWKNAAASRKSMPAEFKKIVSLLRDVEKEDAVYSPNHRFKFVAE